VEIALKTSKKLKLKGIDGRTAGSRKYRQGGNSPKNQIQDPGDLRVPWDTCVNILVVWPGRQVEIALKTRSRILESRQFL
jgi:hypothetical protein